MAVFGVRGREHRTVPLGVRPALNQPLKEIPHG